MHIAQHTFDFFQLMQNKKIARGRNSMTFLAVKASLALIIFLLCIIFYLNPIPTFLYLF